jgi:hypothetical protein
MTDCALICDDEVINPSGFEKKNRAEISSGAITS